MNSAQIIGFLEESSLINQLPKEISEMFEILRNPTILDMDILLTKILRHENLNNFILESINALYFKPGREIDSLKSAISFIGLKNMKILLIAFITKSILPNSLGQSKLFDRNKYWMHSLGTSIASEMISAKINIHEKNIFFAYGLIHDIGIAVLDICLPEILDRIYVNQLRGVPQIVAEKIIMNGLTHGDIGEWLCEKWKLPNDIRDIIAHHHKPSLAKTHIKKAKILHIADAISTHYYENLLDIPSKLIINHRIINELGITEEDVINISHLLPKEVDKNKLLLKYLG